LRKGLKRNRFLKSGRRGQHKRGQKMETTSWGMVRPIPGLYSGVAQVSGSRSGKCGSTGAAMPVITEEPTVRASQRSGDRLFD